MGKVRGFLEHERQSAPLRPVRLRVLDWASVHQDLPEETLRTQGARCMDCGVPFCNAGCPLGNIIPDWNDLVYRGRWQEAIVRLHSTNNFPEFTGLVCPAPCEGACVLGINDQPVTIKEIEWHIIEKAYEMGWIQPLAPVVRTGKHVAIVGSGPAGLAAAQQLNRAGHHVTVFEKADQPGGLLRYGIPDFKLEKRIVERRIDLLRREGVLFRTGVHVGVDIPARQLVDQYDAVLLAGGAEKPRDLPLPGRNLQGIHFAMDFLTQQNRRGAGLALGPEPEILATQKKVIILGGGDTGSDCLGTALRQGAQSVTSLELLERPPEQRSVLTPWPQWPHQYRSSSSHDEGGERLFSVLTKSFEGQQGKVQRLRAVPVRYESSQGRMQMIELSQEEFTLEADLVLLALGFERPVHQGLLEQLGVALDPRGNVLASPPDFATSEPSVFVAGDMRRGQSLVVWALWEGREAARAIDQYLTGQVRLVSRDSYR